ncbi:MAG: glycosyltransferase family 4 protein, partial [Phycisphaerae bacterium]|nr:glycosyltransferase family 4 protein [Phycisphaerae bacterium]NIP56031.1 glycosyltransferase family 4 protein [Phycisphaerae bacterium]NIW50514.1 colanic acid biosynthesis glycosyltransferase WcaL [Gammaproteobacteria bacterium]NIX32361.1 colanic acid biosynthesis glycosyltransferase WcaL [Phycisphaerae bacterium]
RMVWLLRRSPGFLARALYVFPQAVAAGRFMQAEGIEHIHAHYATHPALFAWLIHHLTGLNYSVTVHAHDIFVNQTMLGPKLRDAEFVVAISDFNRDFLARCLGSWVLEKT